MWRQAVEKDEVKKKDKVLQNKEGIQINGVIEQVEMIEKEEILEKDGVTLNDTGPEKENEIREEEMLQKDKEDAEHEAWNWKHMTVDMLWNILSISPRVIALALFASFRLYWFWGLICLQVIACMIIILLIICDGHIKLCGFTAFFTWLAMGLFTGLGTVFTMFVFLPVPFFIYLLYWIIMFTENVVMISLWYQWGSDLGLWYHDAALTIVIAGYVLSLIIKCVHCSFYNRKKESIFEWNF